MLLEQLMDVVEEEDHLEINIMDLLGSIMDSIMLLNKFKK